MSDNKHSPVTDDVLKNVFNVIMIKMPNFLTDEIREAFTKILIKKASCKVKSINDVTRYKVMSNVRKCKGMWEFVFEYLPDGNINIAGYLTGILSTTQKCKFRTLAIAKIAERPEEVHFVGKHVKRLYDAGEITISEYDKLMWKFSQFPESVRNRIDTSKFNPEARRLDLSITPFARISITSKGFTSIPIVIYKPERIELKIAQKFIGQIDLILKHHW